MVSDCLFCRKRRLFLASCFTFLLVHLYKFTNYLPNGDSMYGMEIGKLGMSHFGRWFSGIAEILTSSRYDLQWVSGIASSLFVGATVVIILELFSIDNKYLKAVSVLLFAAFPSMTATQTYSLWASAYMMGLFLSVLGVYICVRHPEHFYLSIPCFTLSMGIYQIYILFAGAVAIYYFANLLLDSGETLGKHGKLIAKGAFSFASAGILYVLIDKVWRAFFNVTLGDYQGISNAGKMSLNGIINGFVHMAKTSVRFFFPKGSFSFYGLINALIILFTVVLVVWKIVLNGNYSLGRRILLCVLFLAVIPVTYAYYLAAEDVWYHTVMEIGNYLVYLIPVLILNRNDSAVNAKTLLPVLTVLLGCLGLYHFVNDNVAYHQLHMSYERTRYQMTETLLKVDSENTAGLRKIAVFGNYPTADDGIQSIPRLVGAGTDSFIVSQHHFINFAKYYMNREFVGSTDEEKSAIEKTEQYAAMSAYPYGNYVSVIDDTLVIKLPE